VIVKQLQRLETWSKPSLAALCLGILGMVAWADHETGYETGFSIFYLTPVFIAAWYYGFAFAVLISVLSATAWMSMNLAAGVHFSDYAVPVWNAAVKFNFYFVVVVLATKLRSLQRELELRVRQRTAALDEEIRERARLQKELLETADQEQRRIGRDLHDSLCQHLTGTAFVGQLLGQKLAEKSAAESAEAHRLVKLIEDAIELTRQVARGLHPIELQAGGVADVFKELADTVSERFKVDCRFEVDQYVPLQDASVATHLLRIAQEAVANAIRHGKATHINVCLNSTSAELELTITDDGGGLPENARIGNGLGLRLMAHRAGMIGATLNVERLPTRGTRVTCKRTGGSVSGENHARKN
jgi:signal transduction histidine kinase